MDDKRISVLRDQPVNKAINKLAAPAIIGMLVMAIYNFVDTMFVSWYSETAPSATQVVLPVMLIASAIGLSLGIGGGSYMSRLLGAKNPEKAKKVAATVFMLGIVFGILVTISNYIFMDSIFSFFGAKAENIEMVVEYGKYIMIGYTFMILNMVLNNLLRSEGSAKFSMIGMMSGSLFNIILDPILIFGFDMGIGGAAIATTISNVISFVVLLSWYIKKKTVVPLKFKEISTDFSIYKEVFEIGAPTFLRQLLISFSMKLMNNAAFEYGGLELMSVIGIVLRVVSIPSYIIFGFSQGFQPVVGYNYGANQSKRVRDSFHYTLKVTSIILLITAVFFVFFGFLIVKIFQTNANIEYYVILTLRLQSIGLIFLGGIQTITVFFQALGKSFRALLLSITRQGLFFIPIILILPKYLEIPGVMLSQPIADILTLILATILIIPFFRKEKQNLMMEHVK